MWVRIHTWHNPNLKYHSSSSIQLTVNIMAYFDSPYMSFSQHTTFQSSVLIIHTSMNVILARHDKSNKRYNILYLHQNLENCQMQLIF